MIGVAALVVIVAIFLPEVLVAMKDFLLVAIQKATEVIQAFQTPSF